MRAAFILFLFGVCFNSYLKAQTIYTLASSQKVAVSDDGSWEKVVETSTIDSSFKEDFLVTKLTEKAESREVQYFLVAMQLEKDLSAQNLLLSQAKASQNKNAQKDAEAGVKELKSKIKSIKSEYKSASTLVKECNQLNEIPPGKQKIEKLTAIGEKLGINISSDEVLASPIYGSTSEAEKLKPINDVSQGIDSQLPCPIEKSSQIGKKRNVKLRNANLLNYTPAKLKNYFKAEDLMTMDISALKEDGQTKLYLKIKLTSKDAAKNYGFIDKGSLLRVNFINQKNTALYSDATAMGTLETYSGHIIYEIVYSLTKENYNLLDKYMLDKIGLMWSSGYEDYDVYNVDVVSNQLECIKKIK